MPDNLTQRFKKELEKQGIVATDAQITSYLQQQGILEQPQQQITPISNSIQQTMEWGGQEEKKESNFNLLEGAGSLLWEGIDVGLLGIPGLLGGREALAEPLGLPKKEEMGVAGRVGMVLGQAAGFMVPLKGISTLTRGAISLSKGGKAATKRAAEAASVTAGSVGISADRAKKAIKSVTDDKWVKTSELPKYSLKGADIQVVDSTFRREFKRSLVKEFPDAGDDVLSKITNEAVDALTIEGRHLNSIGQVLEAKLGSRFPNSKMISRYAADAADMTVSFGLYNVLTDGIRSSLSGSEFTPGTDIWDAFKFSAFLPLIHAIPGGGMSIFQSRKNMNKMLTHFKNTDYNSMSRKEVNVLLNILSEKSKYGANVSNIASLYAGREIPKQEAIKIINDIIKKGGIDRISSEFIRAAGRDLGESIPRMLIGSLYFNSHHLLDEDILKNMPPDELWTHLLVGAFFTKRKKSIYEEKHPMLNNFDKKLQLLRTLNIDASSLRSYARWQNAEDQLGAVHSGLRTQPQVNDVVKIFNNKNILDEIRNPYKPITSAGLESYELVKWSQEVFNLHQTATRQAGDSGARNLEFKNLSEKTIKEIDAKLRKIVINKEGETLNSENFHDWWGQVRKELIQGPANIYLGAIAGAARAMGLQVDARQAEGDRLRISKLEGADSIGVKHEQISIWNEAVREFERMGYIDIIQEAKPVKYSDVLKYENSEAVLRTVKSEIDSIVRNLIKSNYEKNVLEGDLHPINNEFIRAIRSFRQEEKRNSLYKILANDPRMNAEELKIRENLQDILGDEIPSLPGNIVENIRIKVPEQKQKDPSTLAEISSLEPKLHNIARIWGISKADGKRKVNIDLEDARLLVGIMESKGYTFKEDIPNVAYEKMNEYFWSRLIESPDIGLKELGIIRASIDSGIVGLETGGGGRPRIAWPSRIDMERALEKEYYEGYKKTADFKRLMEKYDDILNSIKGIKDKFITETKLILDPSELPDMSYSNFIKQAHMLTKNYDKIVENKINELGRIKEKYDITNESLNTLFGYFKNQKQEYKDLEQSDVIEVRNHLQTMLKDTELKEILKDEGMSLIKNLSDKFGIDKLAMVEASEYKTPAEAIEKLLKRNFNKTSKLQKVSNQIIYNINNSALSRVQGSRRLDMLTSVLTKELKKLGVELDQNKNIGLEQIHDAYLSVDSYGKFINQLEAASIAWSKNYSENQWLEYSKQVRQSEQDFSSHEFNTMEKFNPQYIPKKYGRYNSDLQQSNHVSTLDKLRYASQRSDWVEFESIAKKLTENVKIAIEKKHGEQPEKINKEYERFMNEAFNSVLTTSVGMEKIPVISLEQGKFAKQILEISETISGTGALSRFISSMANKDIIVYKISENGIVDNRKQNIRTVDNIDNIINNISGKNIQVSAELSLDLTRDANKLEHYRYGVDGKPLSGVSVITSNGSALWVRTDNLVDGKLNSVFKEWYKKKLKSLESSFDKAKNEKETSFYQQTITRFKTLYEKMAEDTFVSSVNKDVRNMTRAMYMNEISPESFNKMVHSINNQSQLGDAAVRLLKYIPLAEATGAKSQGRIEVLKVIRKINKEMNNEQLSSIDEYIKNPNFNITAIADEAMNSLNSKEISKQLLKEYEKNYKESSSEIKDMINKLDLEYPSTNSSSIDAQSYLGTKAANVLYSFKSRKIGDNLAGIKPSGAYAGPDGTMLLKTNFVYDPYVASVMDKLKIDILTTKSAAKEFSIAEPISVQGKFKSVNELADLIASENKVIPKEFIGNIKVENIYLGKVTDRKGATSISYALSDFIGPADYKYAIGEKGYIKYKDLIEQEANKISSIINGGRESHGYTLDLIQELREAGEIFDKSQAGLIEYMIEGKEGRGIDAQSVLVKDSIVRMAVKRMMKRLKSPETEGSSYSILKPFIEGKPSVYANVQGEKRQIIYGEKKLPYQDMNIIIRDYNKLKFIINHEGRDIQVGVNEKGKYEFVDNKSPDRKYKGDSKKLEFHLEKIKGEIYKETLAAPPTLGHVYRMLQKYKRLDVSLASMTLRMPNLGGDVAVHRVKGFYEPVEGNVVGVNALDLAVIHQGDFDVDASFNIHDAPWGLQKAHSKNLGRAPDAIVYPSEPYDFDIFENGRLDKAAGSVGGSDVKDGLSDKLANYQNSKMVFGSIKRMSSSVSALQRLKFSSSKDIKLKEFDTPEFNLWLQRYKNTLQSIIDATTKPNFVSKAKTDEIMEWVLFGEAELGNMKLPKELRVELEKIDGNKYLEGALGTGIFEISKDISPQRKRVYKESMIEVVKTIGRPQRILSGIFDEAGRRPPDIFDVNRLHSEMQRFYSNPQLFIVRRLLWKHKKDMEFKKELFNTYYGISDYTNNSQLANDFWNKSKRTPTPSENIFNFNVGPDLAIKSTAGGTVSSIINGYGDSFKISKFKIGDVKSSMLQDKVGKALNELEDYSSIIGKDSFNRDLVEKILEADVSEIEGKVMSLTNIMSSKKEKSYTNHKDVQEYSVMAKILENEAWSLQKFINKNDSFKGKSESVYKANHRLNIIKSIIEGIDLKEARLISGLEARPSDNKVRNHFFIESRDTSKFRKSQRYDNPTNKVHYVYRKVTRNGKTKFMQEGWVAPNGYKYLRPGQKYVILKNPVRYSSVSKHEIIDAYSMLEAVGETIPEYMSGMRESDISSFYNNVSTLRKTIGQLAMDVFEISKENPKAQQNWRLESKIENQLVKEFYDKWLPRLSAPMDIFETPSRPGIILNEQIAYELSSYLLKPKNLHGEIAFQKDIQMPVFKINKRLSNAVFRYLKENGYDNVASDILNRYGSAYRRRRYMVNPSETESQFVSNLYNQKEIFKESNPLVDLAFGKGYLYVPSLMQRISSDIRGRNPREYWKNDINGNLRHIIDYGNFQGIKSEMEFYLDRKNIKEKENKDYWCE